MTLRFLLEKEFKQIMRNKVLPRLIVVFPCVIILVLPWAADSEIRNINLSVVDNDRSAVSARLVEKVVASKYFSLTGSAATYPEAMTSIERGAADIILEIPPRFELDLMSGRPVQVLIAANSVNATKGGLGGNYLSSIMADFSRELTEEYASIFPYAAPPESFGIQVKSLFNPRMDYKLFMVPALMVMLLTILGGFLPAFNIVGEKEFGTIEQINVTPVRKFTLIIAKIIPHWIIGFIILSLCFLMAWAVYGFTPAGSLGTIYFFALIYVMVITGMGLVISNYSSTMQQAMFVMFFFTIVFLLMSGLFTPVNSMPGWAQAITVVNPLKYFVQVMRAVYMRGSAIADLTVQFAALSAFAVVFNIWAVLGYRKSS